MEDCYENLDDGELWLPSDIFPLLDEAAAVSVALPPPIKFTVNNNPNPISTCRCYRQADNEDTFQRVAAFSFHHQRNHHPHTLTTTERFRRCTCTDSSLFERKGGGELLHTGPPPPVYPFQLYPPVLQHQVESLMEARTRTRTLRQMEENRLVQMHSFRRNNRDLGSRFVQPLVGGGGSSRRDYGGTGVFLPRLPTNTNTHYAATTLNNSHATKRQGGRNRHTGQRYPVFI